MKTTELKQRIIKLEKDLTETNKKIQSLINYRDRIESDNDPFNGYF
jgi:hypothetical protein